VWVGLSHSMISDSKNRIGFSMTITLLQKRIRSAQPLDDSIKIAHACLEVNAM
jgi:hypothetical protein